jgi:hypothetical protein
MTDRTVKALENGRFVVRGISQHRQRFLAAQNEDESLTYTIDWSPWLGSDTIDTAAVATLGCGATAEVESDNTTVTLTLSAFQGSGYAKLQIVTDAGLIKELMIYTKQTNGTWDSDYGECA